MAELYQRFLVTMADPYFRTVFPRPLPM